MIRCFSSATSIPVKVPLGKSFVPVCKQNFSKDVHGDWLSRQGNSLVFYCIFLCEGMYSISLLHCAYSGIVNGATGNDGILTMIEHLPTSS